MAREELADLRAAPDADDANAQSELGRRFMIGRLGIPTADPRTGVDCLRDQPRRDPRWDNRILSVFGSSFVDK
jgi:hypothetical protein